MAEENVESRQERARNSTSPEELEKLANDEDQEVRSRVASNTNTPVSLLEKLAEDEDRYVRRSVAANENTPVSVLEKLAEDEDKDAYDPKFVRKSVAGNANTPASLLEKLADDEGETVRRVVVKNTNTPVPLLEKLAEDEGETVRKAVADNTNTPVLVLEKLAGDEDENVRWGVARNKNTPFPVFEKLARDNENILYESFFKAVAAGDLDLMNTLLENGFNINCTEDNFGITPLMFAVIQQHSQTQKVVQFLVERHSNINYSIPKDIFDGASWTSGSVYDYDITLLPFECALGLASRNNDQKIALDLVQYLHQQGAKVSRYVTGQLIEQKKDEANIELVAYLLKNVEEPEQADAADRLVVYINDLKNHQFQTSLVKLAFENGIDATDLEVIIPCGCNSDILNMFAEKGAPLNHVLLCSLNIGEFELAKELIKRGADPNGVLKRNQSKWTGLVERDDINPLKCAFRPGHLSMGPSNFWGEIKITSSQILDFLKFVKEHGGTFNDDLLILASIGNHLEVVQYLLSQGSNVNYYVPSYSVWPNCLLVADTFEILECLLNAGADPNIVNYNGKSSLALRASAANKDEKIKESLAMIKLLISKGANTTLKDNDKKTALSYAKENVSKTDMSDQIVTYLKYFSRINDEKKRRETYLGLELLEAINNEDISNAKKLIEQGASHKFKDPDSKNQLIAIAKIKGNKNLIEVLSAGSG